MSRNGRVTFNKYLSAGFVVKKPWPFFRYGELCQRHFCHRFCCLKSHTECVLGREKEWATFGEMSRCVSYFAFKGNVKLSCLLLRFLQTIVQLSTNINGFDKNCVCPN